MVMISFFPKVFFLYASKKKGGERWVQTFLVVKGRNLQLSNKSLRLNLLCHWLQLTTWRTLYEHELYAVVYSLVLPLYQQQTKLGRRNVFFGSFLSFKSTPRARSALFATIKSRDLRLPDGGISRTDAAHSSRCLHLSPSEALKAATGGRGSGRE